MAHGLHIVSAIVEEVHILLADVHSLVLVPIYHAFDAWRFVGTTENERRVDVMWITPLIWKGMPITAELIENDVLHRISASSTMRYNSQTTLAAETLAHILAKF